MRLPDRAFVLAVIILATLAESAGAKQVRSELRVRVGDKAPSFTLRSADGKMVSLSDFAGRIVLLDFYRAHW